MSKGPWKKGRKGVNPEIINDIESWKNTPADIANAETLKRLEVLERKHGLNEDSIPRIPCPICNSKKYLVESFHHSKILVCERPNCIYERTMAKAKMLTPKLAILVNE